MARSSGTAQSVGEERSIPEVPDSMVKESEEDSDGE